MKKIIVGCLCAGILLYSSGCSVGPAAQAEADTGNTEPRIISTSAALCEVLDKLDLDLIGVPETSFELPERYKNAVKVGLPMTPDMEIVKSLRPTDVISPNSLQYELKPQYENIGVPSTFVNLMSVEGMLKSAVQLGEKYGKTAEAEALMKDYHAFMKEYNEKIAGKAKPKVLILMGLPGSYMIATENSYVGSLVKLAGAENIFGPENGALLNVNTEELIKQDPDIILRTSHAMPDIVQSMFNEEFKTNDIWKHFRAVQNDRVYDLSNERFGMSANLAYKEALNELQTILYEQD